MSKRTLLKSEKMLATHVRLHNLARFLIFLFFGLIIAAAFLPWIQTAFGYGKVIALSPNDREQIISAPITGRLGKWYVHDGSYVKKGDKVVEILDNDPDLPKRLRIEKQALVASLRLAEKAVETSRINVKRQKQLYEEGISSRRTYEKANFELLNYQNQVAKTRVALAKIDVRIARQDTRFVYAPREGLIIRRVPGEESVLVKPGERLAVLVPKTTSRAVALKVKGLDVPLIRKGQTVRLMFEGWPAVQFSGWPSVAVGTFGGRVELIDPVDDGQGAFRILIVPDIREPWPGPEYLRQGVRARGWVQLNRVPLWFELWRRFNGFPPTLDPNNVDVSES